jgi:hypothetical protein
VNIILIGDMMEQSEMPILRKVTVELFELQKDYWLAGLVLLPESLFEYIVILGYSLVVRGSVGSNVVPCSIIGEEIILYKYFKMAIQSKMAEFVVLSK